MRLLQSCLLCLHNHHTNRPTPPHQSPHPTTRTVRAIGLRHVQAMHHAWARPLDRFLPPPQNSTPPQQRLQFTPLITSRPIISSQPPTSAGHPPPHTPSFHPNHQRSQVTRHPTPHNIISTTNGRRSLATPRPIISYQHPTSLVTPHLTPHHFIPTTNVRRLPHTPPHFKPNPSNPHSPPPPDPPHPCNHPPSIHPPVALRTVQSTRGEHGGKAGGIKA